MDAAAAQDPAKGRVVGGEGGIDAVGSPQEKAAQDGVPSRQEQANKTEGNSVKKQGYGRHRQQKPEGGIAKHLFQAGMKRTGGSAVQGSCGRGAESALGFLSGKPRGGIHGQVGQKLLEACGSGVDPAAYLAAAGVFG